MVIGPVGSHHETVTDIGMGASARHPCFHHKMKTTHHTPFFVRFLSGTGLPLFLLSATLVYEVFLMAIVFAPDSTSVWGGFAREFKQWCFNFDPNSGSLEWLQVAIMLVEPPFIVTIALFLWKQPLKELKSRGEWLGQWRIFLSGSLTAIAVVVGLFIYGKPGLDANAPLPFPGERIRTSLATPSMQFIDHKGNPYTFENSQDRVTLVTGIYAACSTSCPLVLLETKALLETLPPETLERLDVVALSLSPEYDTDDLMDRIATMYGFSYPDFRYLNGEPETMNNTTRGLGFSRSVDPESGQINHANLFLVVDAQGKIAYRFTLDDRHKHWLSEAVIQLTNEVSQKELAASIH